MCIDYRLLNSRTIPDEYTTPRINNALDCLTGGKWFSVLDIPSVSPVGFYQFEWMP